MRFPERRGNARATGLGAMTITPRWTAPVAALLLALGLTGCGAAAAVTRDPAPLTAADGYLGPDERVSPFAGVPAVTRLTAALRTAVQDAARDAAADGVRLEVSSGWRSVAYQQALFDAAVARHGSPAAARAHVLPPEESAHVVGRAVDIGPVDAMSWLARHGAEHGLCQTYANEMWHFELGGRRGVCPPPATDASAG